MGRSVDTNCSDDGKEQVNRVVNALSTYRQRCVLYHLMEDDPTTLDEVVDGVAAMETGRPPDDIPSDTRDTLKTELYHHTLPKLAALNVIKYDRRSKTIRYQHSLPHLEEFLRLTRELDPCN